MSKELVNDFTWSVSRDDVFNTCPRKYYYNYYGFWNGWSTDADPRTREIYVLKQLKDRAMWIGQVVHECIARTMKNLSRGVPILPVDEILKITRSGMRQDFRFSRDRAYWQNPKVFCGLFEHEYDIPVSDDEWRDTADTADRCLRNFYDSETYAHLKTLEPEYFLEVEEFRSFPLDGFIIRIKLDMATREGSNVIVWDWKTGRRESDSGLSVQLACYAAYARQEYRADVTQVVTRRVDLRRDLVHENSITRGSLDENLDYITGSIKDMLGLLDDVPSNKASEENFRKVERAEICSRCNFLKVCKPDIEL